MAGNYQCNSKLWVLGTSKSTGVTFILISNVLLARLYFSTRFPVGMLGVRSVTELGAVQKGRNGGYQKVNFIPEVYTYD